MLVECPSTLNLNPDATAICNRLQESCCVACMQLHRAIRGLAILRKQHAMHVHAHVQCHACSARKRDARLWISPQASVDLNGPGTPAQCSHHNLCHDGMLTCKHCEWCMLSQRQRPVQQLAAACNMTQVTATTHSSKCTTTTMQVSRKATWTCTAHAPEAARLCAT